MRRVLALSFILMTVLAISIICFADVSDAYHKDAPSESGDCGDQVKYAYDADNRKLTISGSGDMKDYLYDISGSKGSSAPWMNGKKSSSDIYWEYHIDPHSCNDLITRSS